MPCCRRKMVFVFICSTKEEAFALDRISIDVICLKKKNADCAEVIVNYPAHHAYVARKTILQKPA